jgi:TolB-like protein/DNA-binding winged helix-turn-helix (wHTH) protein/Tfp pilus assembly protein PilF
MPNGNFDGVVQIGEWIVDPSLDTISRGAETQKLEPRTMRLLMCLANSAGAVVSVERLLTEVWTGVVVGSASVYQAVSQLRKLLGDVDPDPTYIATVPRKGYRLIAPVRRVEPASPIAVSPIGPASEAAALIAVPAAPRRRRRVPLVLGGAALIVFVAVGLLLWKKPPAPGRSAETNASIVVLPFLDLTTEKADQSFCDGLTEELSNWLSQIPTLRVVARTSAFAFRGKSEDVRAIGNALNTNHILEGSMRRSGDHMRVTVQLIDARTGYHLWSENFDKPMEDAIKVQEDISRSVAQTLQVRLTPASERQFAARRTPDSQAYQLYLLGRHYAQQLTPESNDRAIELYRQVLTADPKFAPAYVQLAYARMNQGTFHDLPIADVAAQVEPLIESALRIDDRMSGAYAARGALRASESRMKDALDDLQLATSLNPSDMGAFAELGHIRLFDGQPRAALQNYDRAAALDPLNSALQLQRCTALEDLAQYQDAAQACDRARVLQPDSAPAANRLAWFAESRGRVDEALKWNAESLKVEPSDDFDLYWTRATLLLSLGLGGPARTAVDLGRRATKDEVGAHAALVRVVYCEGGEQALRSYLDAVGLDRDPHAITLFEAAYSRLLLGEPPAAKELIARALVAPDRDPGFAETPWYARGARAAGTSYRVDLAVADLATGDRLGAERELNTVLAMLNTMIGAGVERNATYELRAKVFALKGQGDDSMRDLTKAVLLGWRRAWWAAHEPYFASLQSRSDFQALMTQVSQSNEQLIAKLKTDQPDYFRDLLVTSLSCIPNTKAGKLRK